MQKPSKKRGSCYPFGLEHKGYNNVVNGVENNYHTYLGQEWQEELGLNWHSYKWRNADPAIARFFGVDPIAEDYPNQTVYQFASNNPVWKIEIEGLEGYETQGTDLMNGLGFGTHTVFPTQSPAVQRNRQFSFSVSNGVMSGNHTTNRIGDVTGRPVMNSSVQGIVLHRTVSSNAESAINTTINNGGRSGFHIVIDTNGDLTQMNNLDNRANHVGRPTGDINNNNSIGIEVVGMPTDANGNATTDASSITGWQDLTTNQVESTSQAITAIMGEYNLTQDNIFPHEDVSRKTEGEGRTVLNAVQNRVNELNPAITLPPAIDPSILGNINFRF